MDEEAFLTRLREMRSGCEDLYVAARRMEKPNVATLLGQVLGKLGQAVPEFAFESSTGQAKERPTGQEQQPS